MLVPQIVISKRLRRQLKSGDMTDIPQGLFENSTKEIIERIRSESSEGYGESKESPSPLIVTPRTTPRQSPIPSPPLSESDENENKLKKVTFDLKPDNSIQAIKKSSPPTVKRKNVPSSSLHSSSTPHSSSPPSGTPSKKKAKSVTHSSTHSSSSTSSSSNLSNDFYFDLKYNFFGFLVILTYVSLLILGDQSYWANLYRYLAPVPNTYQLIDRSQRFYDDRILCTEIVTPIDGEITSSSILQWWVDGAFLSPGGSVTRRNITFRVFLDEHELAFPNGNTMDVELQGKINLHVDLAKYGLGFLQVNGTDVSGAHEITLEVNVEPLPTDLFYPLTNYGKKLLSATATSIFYFVPPEMVEILTKHSTSEESHPQKRPDNVPSPSSAGADAMSSSLPHEQQAQVINQDAQGESIPQAKSILDSHVHLKQVSLRSVGGCNENIGKSTLLLTISLSESVLTSEPSSGSGFGKAVIVVGEESYDLSSFILEQINNIPYRLLPPLDGAELPYRLKDFSLRLQGVSVETKYMIQLFFCQDQYHQSSLENCTQHAFAWDAIIATCV